MNAVLVVLLLFAALVGPPLWIYRRQLAEQLQNPTPRFLRASRALGRGACLVCGVCCMILIWAGFAASEVPWLYGLLGVVVLGLNLLLLVPGKRPG